MKRNGYLDSLRFGGKLRGYLSLVNIFYFVWVIISRKVR